MKKDNLISKIALGLAGITLLGGCSVIDSNRSLYEINRGGKALPLQTQLSTVDTYQKNLFRNYMEAADDTIPNNSMFGGEPEVVQGRYGVVREMQKERDGDAVIGTGVLLSNVAITYGLVRVLSGDDGSSHGSGNNSNPVVDPNSKTMSSGGSNQNIIYDSFGSGWRP